jgi:hypothetical protein
MRPIRRPVRLFLTGCALVLRISLDADEGFLALLELTPDSTIDMLRGHGGSSSRRTSASQLTATAT